MIKLLSLSCLLLISAVSFPKAMEDQNKFNLLSHSVIDVMVQDQKEEKESLYGFKELQHQIQSYLAQASISKITDAFYDFSSDTRLSESFCKQECEKHGIVLWPSQATFKEAFLGEVFYPYKQLESYYEHPTNKYLLERMDILATLAASVRFHNPLSLYYLTKGIETHINKHTNYTTDFIPAFYKKALETLEMVEENSAVYFLRAHAYANGLSEAYNFDVDKAYHFHEKSNTPESQLEMLRIRARYQGFENPTRKEYESLAEVYPKAYLTIAEDFTEKFEDKVALLQLAFNKGHHPALLELGFLYQGAKQKDKALEYLEAYGNLGYAAGYFFSAFLQVGHMNLRRNLINKSNEEIENAIQVLKKAYTLHHQTASYWLGILLLEKGKRNNSHDFDEMALLSLGKACSLGEISAYEYAYPPENADSSFSHVDHMMLRIKEILNFINYHSLV